MPAMGILQRVTVVHSPMVEHPLVKLASKLRPGSESRHQHKATSGRLNPEKENSPEDPWHNPERNLGLRLLLQHSGETNNTSHCPLVSLVVAQPHHTDLKLLLAPRWELL